MSRRTGGGRGGISRWCWVTVALAASIGGCPAMTWDVRASVPAVPSSTVPAELPVSVTLTSLTPLNPAGAGVATVVLGGVLRNRSDETLQALNAYLRLSRVPLAERADLAELSDPAYRPGSRRSSYVPVGDALAPGATASFRLEVPVESLGLFTPGVYPIGIEVLATVADGSRDEVGRAMTALPWMPAAPDDPGGSGPLDPVGVAVTWSLSAPVDRAGDGTYLSERLGLDLAPSGRLATAVQASADLPVTWLLDPAVAEAAADLADGYQVRTGPEATDAQVGQHSEDAAHWLADVQRLVDRGRVLLAPYGDVDAVALRRGGLGDEVEAAILSAPQVAATAGLVGLDEPVSLVRPADGGLDEPTADLLGAAGIDTVLLDPHSVSDEAVPDETGSDETGSDETGSDATGPRGALTGRPTAPAVLVTDGMLTDLLSAPGDSDRPSVQSRQLLLAHTAMLALTAAAADDAAPDVVIALDAGTAAGPAGIVQALETTSAWLRPIPLQELAAPPPTPVELDYGAAETAAELSPDYIAELGELRARLDLRGTLVGTAGRTQPSGPGDAGSGAAVPNESTAAQSTSAPPAGSPPGPVAGDLPAPDPTQLLVLRAASASWRTDRAEAAALVAELARALDAELGQVQILASGTITLSSRTGRFPLTIANGLDQPVVVDLTLTSQQSARLRLPTIAAIELPPGTRTTVTVSAEASANGEYAVAAQLVARDGTPFGPVTTLTVRATDYDTVAWIVMAVAGVLLVAGSARRITRRITAARVGRVSGTSHTDHPSPAQESS